MSLTALGKVYDLWFIRTGSTDEERVQLTRGWWAWSGGADTGHILMVTPRGFTAQKPSNAANELHETFHDALPGRSMKVEAPTLADAKRVGLVVAFAYDARGFSKSKADKPYRHHFGAETHDDQPPFPHALLPALCVTPSGGLIIKRRPTNTFRLADWVIG